MRSSAGHWRRRLAWVPSGAARPANSPGRDEPGGGRLHLHQVENSAGDLNPRSDVLSSSAMTRPIDIETLCHEKGLRITEQRRVIARVLSESEDHPDVEAV